MVATTIDQHYTDDTESLPTAPHHRDNAFLMLNFSHSLLVALIVVGFWVRFVVLSFGFVGSLFCEGI